MGSDVGQISLTASLHRDQSISYALVCEKEISHPLGQNFNQGLGVPCRIEIFHPRDQNFNQGLGVPSPWLKILTPRVR